MLVELSVVVVTGNDRNPYKMKKAFGQVYDQQLNEFPVAHKTLIGFSVENSPRTPPSTLVHYVRLHFTDEKDQKFHYDIVLTDCNPCSLISLTALVIESEQ